MVGVTSIAHARGRIDFDDLQLEPAYGSSSAYTAATSVDTQNRPLMDV